MKYMLVYVSFLVLAAEAFGQPYTKLARPLDSNMTFQEQADIINRFFDTAKGPNRSMYKQWKRWEWFASHHLGPDGKLENYPSRNFEIANGYLTRHSNNSLEQVNSNSGQWSNLGHVDYNSNGNMALQGRVNCFAFDPNNSAIVYAGTAGGGIWKSLNFGSTWFNISDNLPVLGVSGIAVCNSNSNIIYAISGEAIAGNIYAHKGIGILKSVDAGITWQRTGLGFDLSLQVGGNKILIDANNNNIVLAAMQNGIWRTTDGGNTWQQIFTGDINDIEFKPNDHNTLYCTQRSLNFLYVLNLTTLNWTTRVINTARGVSKMEIGVTPANPNAIYLLAGPSWSNPAGCPNGAVPVYNGLFYSSDSGDNFTLRNNNIDIFGMCGDQSDYDNIIFVHPLSENVLIIGGIRLYRSTDGGNNLQELSSPQSVHGDQHGLERNPLNGSLYLGNDGGIYRSTNDGVDWEIMSDNLVNNEYYRISGFQNNVDLLVGGTQDNGLFKRSTNTNVFTSVASGLDYMDNIIDITNSNIIYACFQNGGLVRSTNGGTSFTNIAVPAGGNWITPIVQTPDPASPNTIFYGSSVGILRSTNGGANWTNINGITWANCIAIGRNGANTILYASNANNLQVCDPIPATPFWFTLTAPGVGNISAITVNPTNRFEVWITYSGYAPNNKVFRSTNGGVNWENVSLSLPNIPIYSIVFANNVNNPGGAVYVGTELGVFYIDDGLPDWEPFYNGLPMVPVTDLEMNYNNGKLYAATFGRGIWGTDAYNGCSFAIIAAGAETGKRFYQASNSIQSTQQMEGSAGNELRLRAGQKITLNPGFYIRNGAYFRALIGNCGTGIFAPSVDSTGSGRAIPTQPQSPKQ